MHNDSWHLRVSALQQRLGELSRQPESAAAELRTLLADCAALLTEWPATAVMTPFNEQTLRTVLDHSDDGIVLVDEQGRIIEWNAKQVEITGIPRQSALGLFIWDVQFSLMPAENTTPEVYERIKRLTQHMLRTGEIPPRNLLDQVLQRTDGSLRIIQAVPMPMETELGYRVVSTIRDVTQQRRIEEELRNSEQRYRTLFDQANDAIFLENERDEIVDANQQASRLLGYSRAELLRMKVRDLQAPEVRCDGDHVVAQELIQYGHQPFEGLDIRRDGQRVPVEITETRLTGKDAGLVLAIVRDITERKRVEQALRANEEQFRLAFNAAAIGKALIGIDGRFIQVNPALCRMLGYTADELLAVTFNDITHPDDIAIGLNYFRQVLAGEVATVSYEKRYMCKDGAPIWVNISSSLIRDEHGQPHHFISEMQDINERKLAETALHDSEEKYRQLFELESDALFLIDNVSGHIYEANAAASALYGYSRDTLLQMKNTDLSAEPDQTRQAMQKRQTLILTRWHRKHDGTVFPVEITARHLVWRGRPVHIAAIRDIAERIEAEQAIFDSERRYRALVETSPDAIVLVNLDGRIQLGNQRAAQMAGLERAEDLIGVAIYDLVSPADQDRIRHDFQNLQNVEVLRSVEYTAQHRNGTHFPIEVTSSIVRDAESRPSAVVAVVRDVTARRKAEVQLQQQNRDLAQLNVELRARNEDLDAFAHTVAHDLKNPLHLLIGYAETFLDPQMMVNGDLAAGLDYIARSGRKMNNIVDELLLLAGVRRQQVTMQPVDVSQTLADAQQRLTDMITDTQAEIKVPATWPIVLGHAPWIEEVWVNYLSNAIKYGGAPPYVEVGADMQADGTVRLWVRDNGDGIAPDVQARLFTPFTRLDQARARGYGLGLSIVRRIVEKMGGQVGMTSLGQPGQGSLFYFTLSTEASQI